MAYDHRTLDVKWQERWASQRAFCAVDGDVRPKEYLLVEFPYPSGEGLHVGHLRSYTAMDVIARKHRMEGKNVLYPMGWDAFGLPAENYAVKTGQHPRATTTKNIANFRRQMDAMGFSFDWEREVNTTDPAYYKWTQWIFLKLFEAGLAYKATVPINWCMSCKIGLANEEVVAGACERCGGPVEQRDREQWMLAITKYAEKLLDGLEHVDYIERAKVQQRNWIGRSEGAKITFALVGISGQEEEGQNVTVFTTRPDTLFGATYLVLAPEHPEVSNLKSQIANVDEVEAYVAAARKKTDIERSAEEKEKTGVALQGIQAINPANGELIPVWVADYVLAHYGTGAIMAVPAHDQRDFAFAQKYKLSVRQVVRSIDAPIRSYVMGAAQMAEGDFEAIGVTVVEKTKEGHYKVEIPRGREQQFERLIIEKMTPGFWNEYLGDEVVFLFKYKDGRMERLALSRETEEHIDRLAAEFMGEAWTKSSPWKWLAENAWYRDIVVHTEEGILVNSGAFDGMASEDVKRVITEEVGGAVTVTYKLRDWVFSRQRYWGEPIPVVFCKNCAKNKQGAANFKLQIVQVGGVDCAVVPVPENQLPVELPNVERYQPTDTGESPLAKIATWVNTACPRCGGSATRETDVMPNWAGSSWYFLRYCDPHNDRALASPDALAHWMPVDWYNGGMEHTTLHLLYSRFWNLFLSDIGVVPVAEPYARRTSHGMILAADGEKMSKSRGNVVNPDEIVAKFGADAVRVYEMFIGPFDQAVPWSEDGLRGCRRFLDRLAALVERVARESTALSHTTDRLLHKTIKRVSDDLEAMRFNTAVAAMMEYVNALAKRESISSVEYTTFLALLAPFAPHLAEELWERMGYAESIFRGPWPPYDPALLVEDEADIVVQVNGRVRATLRLPVDVSEHDAITAAVADGRVAKYLGGKDSKKIVFVSGKLLSIVV